jgi:ATP-binding cassette, subfamily B, bacterial
MPTKINATTRLWRILGRNQRDVYSIFFFSLLSSVIGLLVPLGIQGIISFVQANAMSTSLILLAVMVVITVILIGVLQLNTMAVAERIQQNLFADYTFQIANRLHQLDLQQQEEYYLPELLNRYFDIATLQKGITKILIDLPIAVIQLLVGILILWIYSNFFIVFGLLLIVILYWILRITSPKGFRTSIEESNNKYLIGAWLEELARDLRSTKFGNIPYLFEQKTDEKCNEYIRARTSHFLTLRIQYRTLVIFKSLLTAAMLGLGIYLLVTQQMNVGQFVAVELIIVLVINSVEKIITSLENVYDTLTAVEKIEKLTEYTIEKSGFAELKEPEFIKLEARNVSFSYIDGNQAIQNFNFTFLPKHHYLITGEVNKGKTTLLKLLATINTHFDGILIYNDLPMNNYSLASLRQNISLLMNEQYIIKGSLIENITMGMPFTIQSILECLDVIGIKEMVQAWPNGLDTILDSNGRTLSRSVIKKILLARAIYKKPKLLLLDEPNTNLEDDYVDEVMANIIKFLPNSTIIVSATNTNNNYNNFEKINLQ